MLDIGKTPSASAARLLACGGAILATLAVGIAGCGLQPAPRGAVAGTGDGLADRTAEYRVRCGECAVTYRLANGTDGRTVKGSWSRSFATHSGQFLSIHAETRDGSYAEVAIRIDGREAARERIEGGTTGRTVSATYLVP